VNRLIRLSFGPFQLGELKDGEIEEVKARVLREQIGERLAAISGADFSTPQTDRRKTADAAPERPASRENKSKIDGRKPKAFGGFIERSGKPRQHGRDAPPSRSASPTPRPEKSRARNAPRHPDRSNKRNARPRLSFSPKGKR
jgi:23S rRNA pseudouridine2605 synthase